MNAVASPPAALFQPGSESCIAEPDDRRDSTVSAPGEEKAFGYWDRRAAELFSAAPWKGSEFSKAELAVVATRYATSSSYKNVFATPFEDLSRLGITDSVEVSEQSFADARSRTGDALMARLLALVESEPVEDGMTHAGEEVLAELLAHNPNYVRDHFARNIFESMGPATGADVLRLLGRIREPLTPEWRADLIARALRHTNIQLRDAAVQSAELWGGGAVIAVLRRHDEPVGWLNEYIHGVIRDLERSPGGD